MINAIAIDDEPLALSIIENFCKKLPYINLHKTFTQPNEGLKYLENFPIDVLFLDIHMPALNGIDLYKKIDQNTLVIFCSAHSQYAVEGFDLNALDYLLKPFTFDRFKQAAEKAQDYLAAKDNKKSEFLFIRADYKLQKIRISDILYIEALDDYLKIYLDSQKTLVARMTMKVMTEKLPTDEFVRVHRSFIVPVKKVNTLNNKTIIISDKIIPIGANYEADLLKIFNA